MIIRLSGGIVVPPMCPVTHELGLLDAITHGEGISGGSPNKSMARSSSCHGEQGWYWWNSGPIVPRITLFHSMITFRTSQHYHVTLIHITQDIWLVCLKLAVVKAKRPISNQPPILRPPSQDKTRLCKFPLWRMAIVLPLSRWTWVWAVPWPWPSGGRLAFYAENW